jgi:hypothetical protein
MRSKVAAMDQKLGENDNAAKDESGNKPDRREVQGKGLQMNDNSAEGKKPAKSSATPGVGDKANPPNAQGKGLQVNETARANKRPGIRVGERTT